tara:strand:+ start:89 stop:877 length:789 start_codon:yes stop_codon:yes gene_type:complete
MINVIKSAFLLLLVFSSVCLNPSVLFAQTVGGFSQQDYAELADLPDWSGIWTPDVADQRRQATENLTPWTAEAAREISDMLLADVSGNPAGIFNDCLPEGMPTWMLISHNAFEVLFTPGRVTLLGESDNNRLRRIYTDGREHPEDPDPSYHGHSIAHWEGDTLVVDTIGILPESYIAISEATGVRNGGDMHVKERIYLAEPDIMYVDMEITAPHVLTETWETRRIYERVRGFDIVEGICLQGTSFNQVDEDGEFIFLPTMPE